MRVRIFQPAKSAAQSGSALSYRWAIEPEPSTPRIPEPIMGWASAIDTDSGLRGRLSFSSGDDALAFAKSQGWEIVFLEPPPQREEPRSYMDRFRTVRPEDEEREERLKHHSAEPIARPNNNQASAPRRREVDSHLKRHS